jgi:hypothetical protein
MIFRVNFKLNIDAFACSANDWQQLGTAAHESALTDEKKDFPSHIIIMVA